MAELAISPLAPASFPDLPDVPGVVPGAFAAGLRYKGRLDLAMIRVVEGCGLRRCFYQVSVPVSGR